MDGSDCGEISAAAGFKPGTFLLPPPLGTTGGPHEQHCSETGVAVEVDCKTVRTNYGADFEPGFHSVLPFGAAKRAVTLFCPAAGDAVVFKDCGEAAETEDVSKWPKPFALHIEGATKVWFCNSEDGVASKSPFNDGSAKDAAADSCQALQDEQGLAGLRWPVLLFRAFPARPNAGAGFGVRAPSPRRCRKLTRGGLGPVVVKSYATPPRTVQSQGAH